MASLFLRAFAVWLVIIGAETVHGILRTLLLEPFFGDFRARQIAVFSGALIILSLAFLLIRRIGAETKAELFAVGLFWVVLTLAFEISLGRFVLHLGWDRIFSDYDISEGGLLPAGLLVMLFSPLIAARLSRDPGKKTGSFRLSP